MDLSAERMRVAKALRNLEAVIAGLVETLAHSSAIARIDTITKENPIRTIGEAYSTIDYRMDDEVSTSIVCLGVLGATSDIVRHAESVNAAKAAFKAICAPLSAVRTRIPVKDEGYPTKAIPVIRVLLRSLQRSDLNLLAAYRKIPILAAPPASVTYTRANTRAVYRKSIEEIADLLSRSDSPAAATDRAHLATLGRNETHLALVKERYQNVRANVLYAHLDPRGRGRVQIAAELPILYPTGRRSVAPQVTFPAQSDAPNQTARPRQAKIETRRFLQSIAVYRYVPLSLSR